MKKRIPSSQQPKAQSQQQIAVMLELLRSAVLDRAPVLDPNVGVDWDDLMDRSSKQGILAWVYDGICKLPKEQQPPRQQRINWALSAQEIWDRYAKQKEVLADMVKVCDENGMRMLLLKGIGLSELYPKPESRPSGDIDVYFFEDFEKGNELFARGDREFRNKHEGFDYKGVHVENHLTILDTDTPLRLSVYNYLKPFIDDSVASMDGYYRLPVLAEIIYLLAHLVRHISPVYPISVRGVIDVVLFINKHKSEFNKDELRESLRVCGLDHVFDIVVLLSNHILDISLKEFCLGSISEGFVDALWNLILLEEDCLFSPFKNSFTLQVFSSQYRINRSLCYYCGWKGHSFENTVFRTRVSNFVKDALNLPKDTSFFEGLCAKFKS